MTLRSSDVAACAQTSVSTVRELSDMGLLGPVARSENSNYRQFDPGIIPVVRLWKTLRGLGLGAKELRELGQTRTPETAREVFLHYSEKLNGEIARLQATLDMLQSYAETIGEGLSMGEGVQIRTLPARRMRLIPLESADKKSGAVERQRQVFRQLEYDGNAGCPIGFAYRSFSDFQKHPGRPAQLASYDPQGRDMRPAGEYLVGTERRRDSQKSDLPQRMLDYALGSQLEFEGPAYTLHLLDAACVTEPERFLFGVAVRLKWAADGQ